MERGTVERGTAEETVATKQQRLFARGRDTSRIEYFSDAVFAIALTLLVLDIHVPDVTHPGTQLLPAVLALWPTFLAYGLSFAIIALNWVFHHRKFRAIVRYDPVLIWLNFGFLALVALVPFPTSLLSQYAPARVAVVLYALEVAMLSVVQGVIWVYARHRGLLARDIDDRLFWFVLRRNLTAPVIFLLSIPVALLAPAELIAGRIGAKAKVPVTTTEVKG